ncbi:DUF3995 domain-containing protein [Gordonia sinesedis]
MCTDPPVANTGLMPSKPVIAFAVAGVTGVIHAGVSIYWGVGGDALLSTVGNVADRFDDSGTRWLLIVVGLAKLAAALSVVALLRGPHIPLLRPMLWVVATALVTWGAVNTISASLLATGVLPRPASYDNAATLGHALLWDPLFLAWGLSLATGLWLTQPALGAIPTKRIHHRSLTRT